MKILIEVSFSFKKDIDPRGARIDVPDGADVLQAMRELARRYPAVAPRLFDEKGAVHRHISVLVNGENAAFKRGLKTILRNGDRLTLVPPVGGG